MPVSKQCPILHRDKKIRRMWPINAMTVRPMTKKEMRANDKAMDAYEAEWRGLEENGTWDLSSVQEYKDVAARARRRGKKVHFGIVFGFCVEKIGGPSEREARFSGWVRSIANLSLFAVVLILCI